MIDALWAGFLIALFVGTLTLVIKLSNFYDHRAGFLPWPH
jgi:hypothetical protein